MGFLSAIVTFVPNLLTHYKQKDLTKSSEFVLGLVGLAGLVNEHFKWFDAGVWNSAIVPALTVAVSRFISKGLAPHPAAAASV